MMGCLTDKKRDLQICKIVPRTILRFRRASPGVKAELLAKLATYRFGAHSDADSDHPSVRMLGPSDSSRVLYGRTSGATPSLQLEELRRARDSSFFMNQDHVVMFGLVGCSGVVVNLGVLARNVGFAEAQTAAILTAMTSNYFIEQRAYISRPALTRMAVLKRPGFFRGVVRFGSSRRRGRLDAVGSLLTRMPLEAWQSPGT